ncbi:hypothetical protein NDU88_005003 [Pleurodeles waltl]|uniref:Uncharacterized protein n=1 Tax=Pleurodeles waltl TaxID=8319 RepID=A0AAV7VMB6_PLEWA|nr:hypothetical protein NDU88_005003 [Pleurodeles waltl]
MVPSQDRRSLERGLLGTSEVRMIGCQTRVYRAGALPDRCSRSLCRRDLSRWIHVSLMGPRLGCQLLNGSGSFSR